MVQLLEKDIQTKEVLGWKGLHIFHFAASSCSQKLRIFLNIKGIPWESHHVDLLHNENLTPYFLGINPRGLVPVLVDDGAVHIESNDILLHLEERFPDPALMPIEKRAELERLLKFEDDLHLDLRTLSFRFMFMPPKPPKSSDDLERYASTGSGTVNGKHDSHIDREISFWRNYAERGITDTMARDSAKKFFDAFSDVDQRLTKSPYILGDALSLIDIAWVVYAERLRLAGYPISRLHPRVSAWLTELGSRPEFKKEITMPPPLVAAVRERQAETAAKGQTLDAVCFA